MARIQKQTIKKLNLAPHIESFSRGSYSWINVTDTSQRVLKFLKEEMNLDEEDLEYITQKNPRSKIISKDTYLLIIMRFPYLRKQDNTIHSTHISFVITEKQIVTIHHNKLEALRTFEQKYFDKLSDSTPKALFSPDSLLIHLLYAMYNECLPLTDDISAEIDTLEQKIYKHELANEPTVTSIFTIDRKVVDLRRILRTHLWQTERALELISYMKPSSKVQTVLQAVKGFPYAIWNTLESQMEAIDSMQSAYESLTSYRLNDIIRTLTIISIIIAPLTLITGIFGMNFRFIPFSYHPFGIAYVILLMVLISLWAIIYFKRKKWL